MLQYLRMKKTNILALLIVLSSFAVGIYLYPQLPQNMASHWNLQGEVNGYMSKFWGTFLLPIILLSLFVLFLIIPKLDPLKENIAQFKKGGGLKQLQLPQGNHL